MIHDSGYIYNHLKLDNCIVGDIAQPLDFNGIIDDIRIVEFGLAKRYVDHSGVHLSEEQPSSFEGDLVFSSHHGQNLRSLSRRDDLISLCYLLIYSLEGNLPWLETDEAFSSIDEFHEVKMMK